MSENQETYQTDIEAAMAMLGNGYEKEHAAIIEPPRKVRVLSDKGLIEYQVWGWVKTSANFIKHLRKLKGAKLSVWNCIALSIDESGISKLTISQICSLTDYSRQEVVETIKELEAMGYLGVDRGGKSNIYTPEFVARGTNQPSDESTYLTNHESSGLDQYESSPAIEKSRPSINRVKRVKGGDAIDGYLHFGKLAQSQGDDKVEEIITALERGLKVNISRSLANQQVAKRIIKDGRPLETWLSWVKSDEWRAARLYIYADMEKVWRDYPQAFGNDEGMNPQGLEVGV